MKANTKEYVLCYSISINTSTGKMNLFLQVGLMVTLEVCGVKGGKCVLERRTRGHLAYWQYLFIS